MAGKSIMTPKAILSYPFLAEPREDNKGKAKYSCALIFPKGTDLSALIAAANEAAEEKFGKTGPAKLLSGALKSPFRTDVGPKGYPEGATFINVRSDRKPGCVYLHASPGTVPPVPAVIPDDKIKQVLYAGAMVRATVTAFGYDTEGNKGVSFGLNNVQLIDATTPRLDGRKAATEEFEADLTVQADLTDVGAE